MKNITRASHARKTLVVSSIAWALLAAATIGAAFFVIRDFTAMSSAVTAAQQARSSHSSYIKAEDRNRTMLAEKQFVASRAQTRMESAQSDMAICNKNLGVKWDAKVEDLASQGLIERNPLTGLGLPSQALLDELGGVQTVCASGFSNASEELTIATNGVDHAQNALTAASTRTAAASAVANATSAVEKSITQQFWTTLMISTIVVFLLAVLAVTFWLVASNARAISQEGVRNGSVTGLV